MKKARKRDIRVAIRLTKKEADLVSKKAEKIGLSVSAYIRTLIHQKEKK